MPAAIKKATVLYLITTPSHTQSKATAAEIPANATLYIFSCLVDFFIDRACLIGLRYNSKMQLPLSSGVWTAAFAWQSALFALATIRPLDELLYASRPYRRSPLNGNPR